MNEDRQFILTIFDGQIVNVINNENEILPDDFVHYETYTVEGLFGQVYNCSGCGINYHGDYGFPIQITTGFVEGTIIIVTDFRPLTEVDN